MNKVPLTGTDDLPHGYYVSSQVLQIRLTCTDGSSSRVLRVRLTGVSSQVLKIVYTWWRLGPLHQQTITLKMADQERSDFHVVLTMSLCVL